MARLALEGFTEGLAAELRPEWQIKVGRAVNHPHSATHSPHVPTRR